MSHGGNRFSLNLTRGDIKNNMKGIILAGGTGSRLFPLTKITSKQLLPVYDRQMVFYPFETLKSSGIKEFLIITDPNSATQMKALFGDGSEYGVSVSYCVQEKPKGLPEAFILGEEFIGNDNVTLILGDNIFKDSFSEEIRSFKKGARIFAKEVHDPERFGVVTFDERNKVTSLEEKPVSPKSNLAIVGLYIFDNRVVTFAKKLTPSKRGELEIVDLQKKYLEAEELEAFKITGDWVDAGTFDSLVEANVWAQKNKNSSSVDDLENRRVSVLLFIEGRTREHTESILKTLSRNREVVKYVVVDNASSFGDELESELKRYGDKVVVLRKHVKVNRAELVAYGLAYTRDNVKSDYIFLLEEDTLPEETAIDDFLLTLSRIPEKKVILTGHRVNIPGATDIFYMQPKSKKYVPGTFFETVSVSKVATFFRQLRGGALFRPKFNFIYMQPINSFLYAGTFLPMNALYDTELPDTSIVKYGDDIEYSWRLKHAGYDIYACYTPRIYDLVLSKEDSFSNADIFKDSVSSTDIYLKVHNMVVISRRNTTQTKATLALAVSMWFLALAVYGFFHKHSFTSYRSKLKSVLSAILQGYKD